MARAKRPPAAMPAPPKDLEHSGPVFDRAVRLAGALFADAKAQISLIGDGPAWRSHDPEGRIPSDAPAGRLVVAAGELLWIEDASKDPRFRERALVTGPPHLRFYAGAPIRLQDGSIPGVLAVAGPKVTPFDAKLAARLQDLADFVADEWTRIHARKAGETSARERDAAHRTLAAVVTAAPMSLLLTDSKMQVAAASPRWLKMRGFVGKEVVGRSIYELAPQVFERFRPAFDYCLRGKSVRAERVEVARPDGGVDWMQAEVSPWRDAAGGIGGLIISSHNVTAMVEAMERTERSQERLKLALEIADVHVWEMDYVRGELIKAGAEDTFFSEPKTYDELLSDIWAIVDPRDRPDVMTAWEKHLAEGVPYHPEYRVVRGDDREVWTAGAVRFITDEGGKPLRMVGAMQNITARKAQEQALVLAKEGAEAANLAKSAFLATMSHEIRTPLNGVLGMAQAMAMGELSDQQRERLDVIRQSGESLLAILNDVLDLAKIEAGKLELEQAEFDIAELAKGAHATFTAVAERKGLTFGLTIEPAAKGTYLGDSVRVRQILYNLVSNALKFTETGAVSVVVGRRAGKLRLTVKDSGIGMSPEQVDNLFRKFEQADASTTRRYGGTGLGLAICHDLAALMDGAIAVRSAAGEGTTFTVSLPLTRLAGVAENKKRAAKAAPEVRRGPPLRVLAAEDNAMNQLVLKTLLGEVGVEPVMVRTGREAVAAWEAEPWDLILMDVQMPEMDGPTATGAIRAREAELGRARTPIVALTANAMRHHIAEYAAAGMDAFVAKPIEAARLYAALQGALEPPRAADTAKVA
jgi:PAS domain S-box-containing protein